ncbi:MAG: GGDEF domain-containing protein [Planctomycetota bacterium]|nr:MAG: GGDEF domain-containing protein [Planctomycetota bacterium]
MRRPPAAEAAAESAGARDDATELLLALLGTSLAELDSPVAALAWLAERSDEDLAAVAGDLAEGLRRARDGARRLVGLFGRLRLGVGAALGRPEEAPGSDRPRLLLVGGDSAEAADLTVRLLGAGCPGSVRTIAASELPDRLRRQSVDLVAVSAGAPPGTAARVRAELRAEDPELEVLDLTGLPDAALPAALVAAARRRRQRDAAAAAWRRLEEVSLRDPLTGLLNRRAFDRFVAAEFQRAARYGLPLALALLDLDSFKAVNDQLGHPTGDRVLAAFATLLASCARETDLVARIGGDEFAVLMPHTGGAGGLALIERVRGEAESLLRRLAPGVEPRPGVSAGLACGGAGGFADPAACLAAADRALYRAKRAGKGRSESGPTGWL